MRLAAALLALSLVGCSQIAPGRDVVRWQESERMALLAVGADLASTAYALHHGGNEANPLFRDETAVVTSAVLSVAIHFALRRALRNYPDEIRGKYWKAIAAVRGGAAVWNVTR